MWTSRPKRCVDAVLVAGGISLLDRWMFKEMITAAQEHSLGQNTPVFKNREALGSYLKSDDSAIVVMAEKLIKLYDLTDELDLTMVQLVVRYVLSFPEIDSHTIGSRALEHIKDNIRSAEMGPLDAKYVERINQIQDDSAPGLTPKQFTLAFGAK